MKTGEKGKTSAIALDLRVRERQLANGTLDPKVLERHLAELPDLEPQTESLPFGQPALTDGPGASTVQGHADGGRGNSTTGSA